MDHGSYGSTPAPWIMGCTVGYLPNGSMHHGLYSGISTPCIMGRTVVNQSHWRWVVQWYTCSMDDGLYSRILTQWTMDHGSYSATSTPWVMGCTAIHPPMHHGLYSGTVTPWVMSYTAASTPSIMGCTVVHIPLGRCVVQWDIHQMDVCIVQQWIHPMGDGSYRDYLPVHPVLCGNISTPCTMGCTVLVPTLHKLYSIVEDNTWINTLVWETLISCGLGKLKFGYLLPPIPPVHLPCCISPVPWLLITHPLSSYLPDSFHVSESPNHPFHLFCDNIPLLTPPLCSCSGP